MYDYVAGKVDWMAAGLPVEGEDGPFVGELASEAPTCDAGLAVADARAALDRSGAEAVLLVSGNGYVVGDVDEPALEGHADDVPLLDVLRPVPTTVRPSVPVQAVADDGGGTVLVTTAEGRLLGLATVEGADHHHHHGPSDDDHDDDDDHDHDHDDEHGDGRSNLDPGRFEEELAAVTEAVEERFGDREPSPEELRAFLRERLVAEGRTPEEADRLLEESEAADREA